MFKTHVETTRLTDIADAEIKANGMTLSLPLASMTCTGLNVYDYNEILRERTAGQWTHEATLEWRSSKGWDLLCRQFGGPQALRGQEFTLTLTADPSNEPSRRRFTFARFSFSSETSASYSRLDKEEV